MPPPQRANTALRRVPGAGATQIKIRDSECPRQLLDRNRTSYCAQTEVRATLVDGAADVSPQPAAGLSRQREIAVEARAPAAAVINVQANVAGQTQSDPASIGFQRRRAFQAPGL